MTERVVDLIGDLVAITALTLVAVRQDPPVTAGLGEREAVVLRPTGTRCGAAFGLERHVQHGGGDQPRVLQLRRSRRNSDDGDDESEGSEEVATREEHAGNRRPRLEPQKRPTAGGRPALPAPPAASVEPGRNDNAPLVDRATP